MASSPDMFRSLYEAQYEKMIRFAYRMIGNIESAQDLVQEVFLLALFHQIDCSTHPNPEGWLMKTLKNLILNEQHREQRHLKVPLESIEQAFEQELETSLDLILPKQLTKDEREILIWRFEQRLEYKEIADRLGISQAGCRSRLSRAITHCKKLLDDS